ncbi:MAG TPA: hypothetical protein VFS00_28495 [Polyangiaceae bacterium]|nr:hypothetical protein [Polyangiaceae bacterium]
MPARLALPPDRPALALPPLDAGATVVVRGALRSSHDGSTVDAVKTDAAAGAPAPADPGGLVDFRAGGLRIVEVGPDHQVSAVVTGEPGPACQALGVASPCLPTRSVELARARLLTKAEWVSSLEGEIGVTVPDPPLVSLPPAARSPALAPALGGLLAAALAAGAFASWRRRRGERARSPLGRLVALAERVRAKAVGAPPELSAPLEPALAAALRSLHQGRIDPGSPQGARVAETLRRVEERLDEGGRREREDAERSAADALVLDVESALEAAEEAARLAPTNRA